MKKRMNIIMACTASAVILLGCAKEEQDNGYQVNQMDQQFVLGAALANASEIVLGQLAADSSETENIIEFGEMMVMHHSMAHSELKAIAGSLNLYAPDSLDTQHAALYEMLSDKKDRELDSTYIHNRVLDHQATILLFEAEVQQGANSRLRRHAYEVLPLLRNHLGSAEDIAKDY